MGAFAPHRKVNGTDRVFCGERRKDDEEEEEEEEGWRPHDCVSDACAQKESLQKLHERKRRFWKICCALEEGRTSFFGDPFCFGENVA